MDSSDNGRYGVSGDFLIFLDYSVLIEIVEQDYLSVKSTHKHLSLINPFGIK